MLFIMNFSFCRSSSSETITAAASTFIQVWDKDPFQYNFTSSSTPFRRNLRNHHHHGLQRYLCLSHYSLSLFFLLLQVFSRTCKRANTVRISFWGGWSVSVMNETMKQVGRQVVVGSRSIVVVVYGEECVVTTSVYLFLVACVDWQAHGPRWAEE